jgi:predicted ArsR family transcriptional regulator
MQATRQRILDIIRERSEMTVRELRAELHVTGTGVRQHIAILEREGLIDHHQERGRVGRPALVYTLTPAGAATYPTRYDALATAILEEEEEQRDEAGLRRFAKRIAQRLATPYASVLRDVSAGERVVTSCQILRDQHMVVDWKREAGGYTLSARTCPYPEVADRTRLACAVDVAFIGELTAMDVELSSCMAEGDARCTYALSPSGARSN